MNKKIQLVCSGFLGLASVAVATDVVPSSTPQSGEIPVLDRDHFLTTKKVGYAATGGLTLWSLSTLYKGLSTKEKRAAVRKLLSSEHGGIIAGFSKRMDDPAVRAAFRFLIAGAGIGIGAAVLGYLTHNSVSKKITTRGIKNFEYLEKLSEESVNPAGNWALTELEADAKKHGHGCSYNLMIKKIEKDWAQAQKKGRAVIERVLNGEQVDTVELASMVKANMKGFGLTIKRLLPIAQKLVMAAQSDPELNKELEEYAFYLVIGGEPVAKQFPKMQALLAPQELARYRDGFVQSIRATIASQTKDGFPLTPQAVLFVNNEDDARAIAKDVSTIRAFAVGVARSMATDSNLPEAVLSVTQNSAIDSSFSQFSSRSSAVLADIAIVQVLSAVKEWLPEGDADRAKLDAKIAAIRDRAMAAFRQ